MDVQIFLAAAAAVTKAVDLVRNALDSSGKLPKFVWNILAFGFGVGIAYVGGLNALPSQDLGQVLTGLAIGAGASGWHEVFDFFSSKASAAKSVSVAPIDISEPQSEV